MTASLESTDQSGCGRSFRKLIRRFFGLPGRGGMLAITNVVLMTVCQMSLSRSHIPGFLDTLLMVPLLVLHLPLLPFMFQFSGDLGAAATVIEVRAYCVFIGVNSFLWGYAVAWIVKVNSGIRDRARIAAKSDVDESQVDTHK